MGTYNTSNQEIILAIEEALDNLEGDFTDRQLKDCLNIMTAYPHVSDKWKNKDAYNKLKELEK